MLLEVKNLNKKFGSVTAANNINFKMNENEEIIETKVFNTKDIDTIKFSDDKTPNQIVKRGLLEKIFGGVGTQQELPTTP